MRVFVFAFVLSISTVTYYACRFSSARHIFSRWKFMQRKFNQMIRCLNRGSFKCYILHMLIRWWCAAFRPVFSHFNQISGDKNCDISNHFAGVWLSCSYFQMIRSSFPFFNILQTLVVTNGAFNLRENKHSASELWTNSKFETSHKENNICKCLFSLFTSKFFQHFTPRARRLTEHCSYAKSQFDLSRIMHLENIVSNFQSCNLTKQKLKIRAKWYRGKYVHYFSIPNAFT